MSSLTEAPAAAAARYPDLASIIDGERVVGAGTRRPVRDPATGRVLTELPLLDRATIARATESAVRAFATWRRSDAAERARLLRDAADLLRRRSDAIAVAMTLENGKPIGEARGEVAFSADILDFFAGEAERPAGRISDSGTRNRLTFGPIGPIAAFTTWNYPLTVPARKLGAALAAGCTVVLKADEDTPASAAALVEALVDAGLPAGVVQLVFGDPAEVSEVTIAHPGIRKVSFTGSAAVGRLLAERAGRLGKPLMLELGGHAPVLVFDDVDVEAVARQAVGAKFHNAGQSCGSPTRFLVQESVHDPFVDAFAAAAREVRVDDGIRETTVMGALGNERRIAAIRSLVDDAVERGARAVTGGALERPGHFWAPTLLTDVPDQARAMHEEPFGPLALTRRIRDADEAIGIANSLPYGLAAYVFTDSARRLDNVTDRLEVGMIGANVFGVGDATTYFGGAKESGYGAEGGPEAVSEYQVPKLVAAAR
jgi:succinate-semialdehyde dehydrogenase / glutarate-semialdehyde dehydrogenase